MKFTLKWLEEYVSIEGLSAGQLAEKLTMLGLEVDAVKDLSQGLDGIVTAKIVKTSKHPNADRLTLCEVEVGSETVKVVCGAPNAREGLVTAIARPGVTLPNGLKIKKARVRGEESLGMLCAEDELGLSDDHSGIIEIKEDVETGTQLVSVLGLDDVMIDIDLTPNRPDCTSVIGIAREVSGFTGNEMRLPVAQENLPVLNGKECDYAVVIKEPELCPRYAARKLTGISIGTSPAWMQQRLLAVGMRPVNNIVDITNYVMLETGQPLHAFDYHKVSDRKIVVRCPGPKEKKFTTLDGKDRKLEPDMLMICDAQRPIAVAGIMGGLESEVSGDTTAILLESASFNPVNIRKTARTLSISSEASYRFERGVDPGVVDIAMERAVSLMVELTGAQLEHNGVDEYPGHRDLTVLDLRIRKICDLLGMEISGEQIARYLDGIGFTVHPGDEGVLLVTVPSFRVDVEREIDLVEEIARLVGYDDIPTTLPKISMDYPKPRSMRTLCRKISSLFTSKGHTEAINYSFVSEKQVDFLALPGDDRRRKFTRLLNPLTEEQSVMRTMILPGLLENIRHNINHQTPDISLFEIGKIFIQHDSNVQPEEKIQLCAVMSGSRYPEAEPLYFSGYIADLFDLKGIARSIFTALAIQGDSGEITFKSAAGHNLFYSREDLSLLIMDGEVQLGMLGMLTTEAMNKFNIKQEVYFLEIDLSLVNALPVTSKVFKSLPRFPSVKRDIALVVPENVAAGELLQSVYDLNVNNVEKAELFDIYRGKPIDAGMKSVALSVTYRSSEKTLDDETVDIFHDKIVDSLMSRYGGRYRD